MVDSSYMDNVSNLQKSSYEPDRAIVNSKHNVRKDSNGPGPSALLIVLVTSVTFKH